MIVTSMQLTISSRRDIAVLQKESSALEGEEDVKVLRPIEESCRISRTDFKRRLDRWALRKMKRDQHPVTGPQRSLRLHEHQVVSALRKSHRNERLQLNGLRARHFGQPLSDARLVNAD